MRSALAQDVGDLEVVVSDDASPDPEVARAGERLAREDARVRFTRQPRNLGHAGNYRWVLEAARGELLHVALRRRLARSRRTRAAASRRCARTRGSRWWPASPATTATGAHVVDERPIDLTSARPAARVVRYFWRVNMNGPLFGVARREDLLATPFRASVGGDWLLVAAMAARGGVRTLPDVHVHRSMDGLGGDQERLARSFGLQGFLRARHHHLLVAWTVARDVGGRDPAYAGIARPARIAAGLLSGVAVVLRFPGLALLRAVGLAASSGARSPGSGRATGPRAKR